MTLGRMVAAWALCAAASSGCHKKAEVEDDPQQPVAVRCVAAVRAGVDETVIVRGWTAPPPGEDLPVAAQIAGRVIETRVKEGDRVAKGTIVAVVDDLAPKAAARQADAALARARAEQINAQAALDRAKTLAQNGIASQREVEDAIARAEAAKTEVDASLAGLRLASGTLGRVEVRSTFEGVVTKVWRGVGALVDGTASTPIVELASTRSVELVAAVTERELALFREGQRATVTLPILGVALDGEVLARALSLDPATGLGTVRVRLEKPDPAANDADARTPPLGAFGKAVVSIAHRDGVIAIPPSALRGAVADGAEIAICKGNKAEIRAVQVGYRDATQVEITEGVKEGDKVVVDHALGLEDDTAIVEAGDTGSDAKGKKPDENDEKAAPR